LEEEDEEGLERRRRREGLEVDGDRFLFPREGEDASLWLPRYDVGPAEEAELPLWLILGVCAGERARRRGER
jgi:hypothetical protein